MKRRSFLNQMGYGIPAPLAFSSFPTSCNKNQGDDDIPTDNRFKDYKVVVVGAGASGLYTAWYLKERGFNVTLLEASDEFGGRIKSLTNVTQRTIEYPFQRAE